MCVCVCVVCAFIDHNHEEGVVYVVSVLTVTSDFAGKSKEEMLQAYIHDKNSVLTPTTTTTLASCVPSLCFPDWFVLYTGYLVVVKKYNRELREPLLINTSSNNFKANKTTHTLTLSLFSINVFSVTFFTKNKARRRKAQLHPDKLNQKPSIGMVLLLKHFTFLKVKHLVPVLFEWASRSIIIIIIYIYSI